MNIIDRLLRKNMSTAQVIGFVLSNFIGLSIVVAGIQLYLDLRPIWEDEDSFLTKDYLIVNKRVTASNTLGEQTGFTAGEIADLSRQPWVRSVGSFTASDYHVSASVQGGGHSMSTFMFFESIPDSLMDIRPSVWHFTPGATEVPIIISKDYLTLYNFGFASSAGLPKMSEQLMGSIPLRLTLSDNTATRTANLNGRVVGFSNRLNTILVPEDFMRWSNANFGSGEKRLPSRLIIDVSSPGDSRIATYLEENNLESAGDKSASQASFLLNIIAGIVMAIGAVITVLSLFILMLSISLLMQKNRDKLHALLQLGYTPASVASPYNKVIIISCAGALVLALIVTFLFRLSYLGPVNSLGGGGSTVWIAPLTGVLLATVIIISNLVSVRKRVLAAWGMLGR